MKRFSVAKRRRLIAFITVCMLTILVASCATQPYPNDYNSPGFFSGMLHGFLIFFGFVGSIFTDYRIYAFPNSGGWYDFGYLIGASMFLGGGGASASS